MNPFDHAVIVFVNRLAGRSWSVDELIYQLASNYLLKTGVLVALLCWTWFRRDDDGRQRERRTTLVFGLLASCVAVGLTRILSFVLPFRDRPLRAPNLHFVLPLSIDRGAINGWSAFPSDNATLFFGIALAIFLVSRRAGILAFCHTLVVVAFARVYLGYHYPTDILGGAAIGMGAVALARIAPLRAAVTRAPMRWLDRNPQAFHTAFCLLVFFIGTTFEPLYPLAHFVADSAGPAVDALGPEGLWWAALLVLGPVAVGVGWAVVHRLRRPGHPIVARSHGR